MIISVQSNSFALSLQQKENIKLCQKISIIYNLDDIIPVLCGIETSFGLFNIGDNNKSFGILQMRLNTAKDMLKRNNVLIPDKNLKYMLTNDKEFSIILSCIYMKYLIRVMKGDINKAILSFNVGMGNVKKYGLKFDPNDYLTKFEKYKKIIKEELE